MTDEIPIPTVSAIVDAVAPGKDLKTTSLPALPITIDTGTAAPAAVVAGVRYILSMVAAFAVGRGWISNTDAGQIAGLVVALLPVAWGVYEAVKSHNTAAALEPFAPVEVAVRK